MDIWQKIQLDPHFTKCTRIDSKWIRESQVNRRKQTIRGWARFSYFTQKEKELKIQR